MRGIDQEETDWNVASQEQNMCVHCSKWRALGSGSKDHLCASVVRVYGSGYWATYIHNIGDKYEADRK